VWCGSRCMGSHADLRLSGTARSSLASTPSSTSHRWRDGPAGGEVCLRFSWEDRFPRDGKVQAVDIFYENHSIRRFPWQARKRGTPVAISGSPSPGKKNPGCIGIDLSHGAYITQNVSTVKMGFSTTAVRPLHIGATAGQGEGASVSGCGLCSARAEASAVAAPSGAKVAMAAMMARHHAGEGHRHGAQAARDGQRLSHCPLISWVGAPASCRLFAVPVAREDAGKIRLCKNSGDANCYDRSESRPLNVCLQRIATDDSPQS
jgi:hypothetical protein